MFRRLLPLGISFPQVPIQAPAHPSIQPTGKTADSEGIEMKKATSHSRIRLIICLGHRKGSINICFCPYSPSDRNRTAISTSVKPASHHLLDKLLAPFSLWKQHCDRLRTSQPDFTKENPTLFTGWGSLTLPPWLRVEHPWKSIIY